MKARQAVPEDDMGSISLKDIYAYTVIKWYNGIMRDTSYMPFLIY